MSFSPGHFRRRTSRLVSYYALFECMAASEPTSRMSSKTHILLHLTRTLGPNLEVWSLSLLTIQLISYSLTPDKHLDGIRSLISFGKLLSPRGNSVLYLRESLPRLALKLFRGEPAISGFDWNFSPIHTSSPPFSTDVGSVLHCHLRQLQPGHG